MTSPVRFRLQIATLVYNTLRGLFDLQPRLERG